MNGPRLARRRRIAVAVVLLTAIAGCSSTNKQGDGPADPDDAALASASPAPGTSIAPDGSVVAVTSGPSASAAAAASAGGAVRPGGTRPGGTGGGAATQPGSPSAPKTTPARGYSGRIGPGVSATEIKIGITLFKLGDFGKNFGAEDVDPGDTEAQANAAVAHINSQGGIAGRKVVPVYHTFDLTRPGLQDGQSEQEACAKWTQDDKVFAVINITYARLAILSCLAASDVPGIHDALPIDYGTLSKYFKYWYSNVQVVLDRMVTAQVRSFCSRGFFKPDGSLPTKVGIQYFEDPAYRKIVDTRFLPELAKCGVPKDKVVLQGAPRGGTDGSVYAARFKSENVTHVMFLGEASLYPLFFMRGAEDQQYRPKYGLSTAQTPALLLQDLVPARQLEKAIGMGWLPTSDVDAPQDPGPVSPRNTECLEVQRKAGQDMSNRQAAFQSALYCGGLWWLQQTMARSTGLNSDGLFAAAHGLGSSFTSPSTFGATYSANKHDGPIRYRDFAWVAGSNKSRYVSGNKTMQS